MSGKKDLETVWVFAALLCAAAVFTWPLVLHIREAVPLGSEPKAVAYFQLFTMQWTAQAFARPAAYWHAPFFYPFAGAFAWCEPQLFNAAIVAIAARAAGRVVAYNMLILVYMALMGLGGYCTARLLTEDKAAAFFSALWLCAGAFSLQQLCAPALLSAWALFFCILFVFLYAGSGQAKYFWPAALFYLIAWFTAKQAALALTLFLPCILWPWLAGAGRHTRLVGGMLAMCALAAAAVVPYAAQQGFFTAQFGFEKPLEGIFTVGLRSLFIPAKGHWLSSRLLGLADYSWSLGIAVCLILLTAVILGFLRRHLWDPERKRIGFALATLACAGLFLALAPNFKFYGFIHTHVPGFSFVRVPGRSIVFSVFALSVLAAPAFAWLRGRMNKSARRVLTAAVYMLVCAEMWTVPVPLVKPDEETEGHQAVITWLKTNEPAAPVIELPVKARSSDMEAAAMLRMLEHGHPLINGYASFTPVPHKQLKQAWVSDPKGKAGRFLKAYGARYALVHEHLLTNEESVLLADVLQGAEVFRDPGHTIYRLPEPLYIGKGIDLLPEKSYFGAKKPAPGKRYAMPLGKPLAGARLVYLAGESIPMEWKEGGKTQRKMLSLRGAVILDKGEDHLRFRILTLPEEHPVPALLLK